LILPLFLFSQIQVEKESNFNQNFNPSYLLRNEYSGSASRVPHFFEEEKASGRIAFLPVG